MKKLVYYGMTICLLSTFSLTEIKAMNSKNPEAIVSVKPVDAAEVQALINRVEEIKAMNIKSLTLDQKKALKKELKAIKSELKVVTGI